jgi:hypothetical protein
MSSWFNYLDEQQEHAHSALAIASLSMLPPDALTQVAPSATAMRDVSRWRKVPGWMIKSIALVLTPILASKIDEDAREQIADVLDVIAAKLRSEGTLSPQDLQGAVDESAAVSLFEAALAMYDRATAGKAVAASASTILEIASMDLGGGSVEQEIATQSGGTGEVPIE